MKLTAHRPQHRRIVAPSSRRAGAGGSGSGGDGDSNVVDGGTFTLALGADPGTLDPQMSAGSALFSVTQFAYDTLVSVDPRAARSQSALAKEWKVDGTTVTLTLDDGITCSDGSTSPRPTAADNIAFVADPENQSPFLGAFLPGRRHGRGRRRGRHRHADARSAGAVRAQRPREPADGLRAGLDGPRRRWPTAPTAPARTC